MNTLSLFSQDLHWSQPANALLYQNPAFTGINSKFNINANYHNQWNAVNTSYNSYQLAGDYRFGKSEPANAALSVGAILYNDNSGVGNFRTTNAGLTTSCLLKLNNKTRFGAGVGYNFIQRTLQANNFAWGSQYDGQKYNSSIMSGESNGSLLKTFSDLNAGLSMAYDKSEGSGASRYTSKFILGYSINHINRPSIAMDGGQDRLHIKHIFFANGNFPIKDNLSLKPSVLFYWQGSVSEITIGSLMRYSLGQQSKITGYRKGSAFSFGALYRYNDAIIPTMEFEKGNLLFGLSYDVNVSKLSTASKFRGGIELSIRLTNISNYLYKNKK